jgi:hypothetical protein
MRKLLASTLAAFFLVLSPRPAHAGGIDIRETEGNLIGPNGELYSGTCLNVLTPRGENTITCSLRLVSGEPERHIVIFSYIGLNILDRPPIPCTALLTPFGNAEVFCHN